jgi:O-antigen ligase
MHPLWGMNAEVLGKPLPGSISLSVQDSLSAVMRLLSYGLVFFLAFQYGRNREKALSTFRWLAFAGFAYAIYGLIIFWGEFGTLFWFFEEGYKADVRGTFVNRNSFATYIGLSLLCAIAVFNQQVTSRRRAAFAIPVGREQRIERFILQVWKPLTAILLMTTALILTHSRGGFFSTLAGGMVLLFLLNKRQQMYSAKSKAVLGGAVLVAVLAFVLTSEVLLQRIDRLTVDSSARIEVYGMTADAIGDNPVLGFGYGTFTDSFRLYRDDRLGAHFDKTHNTYLENIFELGWPVAGVLFLCIAWLTLLCFRGAWNRGRDWVYPATGAAASVLVGIHSLFDFSLQMPGVAITYACILGVGCAQSYSSSSQGL